MKAWLVPFLIYTAVGIVVQGWYVFRCRLWTGDAPPGWWTFWVWPLNTLILAVAMVAWSWVARDPPMD